MNKTNDLEQDYRKWIGDLIRKYADQTGIAYISKNLWLLTAHLPFSTHLSTTPFDRSDHLHKVFRSIYLDLCRALLGRHFARKKHLQPLAVTFYDVEGTKRGSLAAFDNPSVPHIHGLVVFHPATIEAFEDKAVAFAKQKQDLIWKRPGKGILHLRPCDGDPGSIEGVAGYIAKLATMASKADYDSFRVYPEDIPFDVFQKRAARGRIRTGFDDGTRDIGLIRGGGL